MKTHFLVCITPGENICNLVSEIKTSNFFGTQQNSGENICTLVSEIQKPIFLVCNKKICNLVSEIWNTSFGILQNVGENICNLNSFWPCWHAESKKSLITLLYNSTVMWSKALLQMYTRVRNVWSRRFLTGNQSNHQKFVPSLLTNKLWRVFRGIEKKMFWKTKFKMADSKKSAFFKIANSQKKIVKASWIGPWVSRIDWCKGHWCSSTYIIMRMSDMRAKTG